MLNKRQKLEYIRNEIKRITNENKGEAVNSHWYNMNIGIIKALQQRLVYLIKTN